MGNTNSTDKPQDTSGSPRGTSGDSTKGASTSSSSQGDVQKSQNTGQTTTKEDATRVYNEMKMPDDFKRKENTDDPNRRNEREQKESRDRESGTVNPETAERTSKDTGASSGSSGSSSSSSSSSSSDFMRSEREEKRDVSSSRQEEKRDMEMRQEDQRERQKERGEKTREERVGGGDRDKRYEEKRERDTTSKSNESTMESVKENVKEAFGKGDKDKDKDRDRDRERDRDRDRDRDRERDTGSGMTMMRDDHDDRRSDLKEKNDKRTSSSTSAPLFTPNDPKGVRDPKSHYDMTHRDERRDMREEQPSERERKTEMPKTRGFPETDRKKKDVTQNEMTLPSRQQQQQQQGHVVVPESKMGAVAGAVTDASRLQNEQLRFSNDISDEQFDSFKKSCGNGSLDKKYIPNNYWFTFLMEGEEQEDSLFHSRKIHLPPNSGVTLGRGYDLGNTTPEKFVKMMDKIGVSHDVVDVLKPAVGKKQEEAKTVFNLLRKHPLLARDILTKEQQRSLFYEYAKEHEEMVTSKCKQGWNVDFSSLSPLMQDILFDLCVRDDLHPSKQSALRLCVEKNNLTDLYKVMQNKEMWREVPADRFQKRCEYLELHIKH